jgi:membrane protein implicated in regulation of membrane protease activity
VDHLRRADRGELRDRPADRETIVNDDAVGKVRIDGEVWTARTYDDDHVIEAGTRVHVMEIKGATALVSD